MIAALALLFASTIPSTEAYYSSLNAVRKTVSLEMSGSKKKKKLIISFACV